MRLAIVATYVAGPLVELLRCMFDELGLTCDVELAPYDQVFQQLADPASLLARGDHDAAIVLVRPEDFARDAPSRQTEIIDRAVTDLAAAVRAAAASWRRPPLLCVTPSMRTDEAIARAAIELGTIGLVVDASSLLHWPGASGFDVEGDRLGHVPYSRLGFAAIAMAIGRRMRLVRAAATKVIAIDCDNTLWGGICGEDGVDGIVIDGPRRDLHAFLNARRAEGQQLCIVSKNNEADVDEVFTRRSELGVRTADFVARRIHWGPKSDSIRSLARELNLGLDAFVFLDDDPRELAEVEAGCPEVVGIRVPPGDHDLRSWLATVWAFDTPPATAEDRRRGEMWNEELQRRHLRAGVVTLREFIASLELSVVIAPLVEADAARVAQLTQRTNQFNNGTAKRSEPEVLGAPGEWWTVRVADRFGDYGLVGAMHATVGAGVIGVDALLLSCRALGRGVEHQMLAHLGRVAVMRGLERLEVTLVRTARNTPVVGFLESLGGAWSTAASLVLRAAEVVALRWEPNEAATSVDGEEPATSTPLNPATELWRVLTRRQANQGPYDARDLLARVARRIQATTPTAPAAREAPRTPTEAWLAGQLAALLNLDDVAMSADLIDVGVDSLVLLQLSSRIIEQFGVEVPLELLFEATSLPMLAEYVEDARRPQARVERGSSPGTEPLADLESRPRLVPSGASRAPLTPPQRGTFRLDRWQPENGAIRFYWSWWLDGSLDTDALERALRALRERHGVLRSRFFEHAGEFWQELRDDAELPTALDRLDLSGDPNAESSDDELQREFTRRPFDLGCGQVVRALLVRFGPARHRFTVCVHRIACDDLSVGVLADEFAQLWRGIVLEPPVLQYIDLADYLARLGASDQGQEHRAFWLDQLTAAPPIELPVDRPRAAVDALREQFRGFVTFPVGNVEGEIASEDAERVQQLARDERVSLQATLLAAMAGYLSRLTGQSDLSFVSHLIYRHLPGLERAVGLFGNPLVLRVSTQGAPTVRELVGRTQAVVTNAFQHANADVLGIASPHLFRFWFNYLRITRHDAVTQLPVGVHHEPARLEMVRQIAYDALLFVAARDDRIDLQLLYNPDLFSEPAASRLLHGYIEHVRQMSRGASE